MGKKTIEIKLNSSQATEGYINITEFKYFFEVDNKFKGDKIIELKCNEKKYFKRIDSNQITGLTEIHRANGAKEGTKVIITKVGKGYELTYSPNVSSYDSDEKMKKHSHSQTAQPEEKCQKTSTEDMPKRKPFEQPTKMGKSIESQAFYYFEKYMATQCSDIFKLIEENGKVISDIHRRKDGYESVFADYVVYDEKNNKKVFFEIKGTSKTEQYWGGVTFKELKSAIEKRDDYYFAIICIDESRKDPFIHPKRGKDNDPYGVFLTLDEFLQFSTRASLGIQFVIKYPDGEDGELEPTNNGDKAYTVDDVNAFLDNDFIKENI